MKQFAGQDARSRLHLELERDPGEPITGAHFRRPDGSERPFIGWLDLLAALDAACAAARAEEAADGGQEASPAPDRPR